MFPVPVGNTTAASQQFGMFNQTMSNRRYEEENADYLVARQAELDAASAHESAVEDEIDEIEEYENTLSTTARQRLASQRNANAAANINSAYPSMAHTFDPLNDQKSDLEVHVNSAPTSADYAAFDAANSKPQTPIASGQTSPNHPARAPRSSADISAYLQRRNSASTVNEETLHLGQISDEEIRAALDPNNADFTAKQLESWSDERLKNLVDTIQPVHLPVLMNRMNIYQSEKAKNFSFHHLKYSKRGVTILNDVSGYIESGMLVGVLGAPDSGITPLLNILAGRQQGGDLSGDVLYDGHKRSASFKRYVGYVVKEDPHLAHLTVFETLFFSARLRLPTLPIKMVKFRVAMTLKLLGLSHVANSVVGDGSLRGISGGEKRRVSFGIEMVAGHASILADLPTNGLDSSSAYSLMRTMRFATKAGFSMMAAVVQPAPQLLRLFHRVMLMSKGTCVYFGPVGQAEDHFLSAGFVRPTTKALPQFLEELSLKPELFYRPKLAKRITDESEHNTQMAVDEQRRANSTNAPPNQDKAPLNAANANASGPPPNAEKAADAAAPNGDAPTTDGTKPKSAADEDGDTEPVPPSKTDKAHDIAKAATNEAPPEPVDPSKAPAVLTDAMGVVIVKDGADKLVQAPADAPPSPQTDLATPNKQYQNNLASPRGDSQQLVPSDPKKLPDGINQQRFMVWEIMVEHYKKSVFYRDVIEVLLAQEQRKKNRGRKSETASAAASASTSPRGAASQSSAAAAADTGDDDEPKVSWVTYVSSGRFWYDNYNSSPALQLQMNLYRQTILTIRNEGLWRDNWLLSVVMGLFLGSLFYNQGTSYREIQDRVGLFFFILSYLAFNAVQLVPVLAHQREVYYNQLAGGYYHGFTYYIGHVITQIPIVVVETLLLLLPVWGLSGLSGGDAQGNFWYAYLVIGFNSLISRIWMILLAAVSPNEVYADVLNTVTNIIFTKLCGYFVIKTNIVRGWYWVYVISYFSYSLRGLAKDDIGPLNNLCGPNGQTLVTADNPCLFTNGQQALSYLYGINDLDKWGDFVDLVWFMIAFNFGAMMASTYVNWQTQDDAEHPDFGETLDKKHRDIHSDIMQSQAQIDAPQNETTQSQPTSPGSVAQPNQPPQTQSLANDNLKSPRDDGANGAYDHDGDYDASKTLTYQHKMEMLPKATAAAAEKAKSKKAYLQWNNLEYTVFVGKEGGGTEPRVLLKKVFGFAKPGKMTALMGASGAGKSTLLDVLAGKKTGGKITGDIIVNGQPVDFTGSFSRIAGYVEQFDSHNAFSTVREAVMFSGRLRLPRKTTTEELNEKVDHCLSVLGIKHLGDAIIGSPGFGGVSQEVRKKVTIAVELIMEPSLLFLDEPTTGLDSAGAFAVLSAMQLLAKAGGMTVVCTIHQPSAELAGMFDQMLLMKPGGELAFFGPFTQLPDWFKENNLGELAPGQNPADFALEQIKRASAGKDVKGNDVNIAQLYANSQLGKQCQDEISKGIMPEEEKKSYVPPRLQDSQPAFPTQLYVMTERFFLSFIRNTSFIAIRYFLAIFMGFVVGTVFITLGYDQQYSDQRISAIFVVLIFVMFTSNAFLPDIFFLRPIYFREQGSKMYDPLAFYLGRFISDIPFVVTEIFLLCVMVYFICGLNTQDNSRAFGLFFLTMLGVRWTSIFFTWAVGTAIESPNNANTIQSTYFNLMMILTGFILPGPYIASWWVWFYDIAFLKYALHFAMANEMRSENFYCSNNELIPFSPTGNIFSSDSSCPTITSFTSGSMPTASTFPYCDGVCILASTPSQTGLNRTWGESGGLFNTGCGPNCGKCRFTCGDDVFAVYGVQYSIDHMARNEVVLWCFGIFFFIVGYFALRYINHIKR